MNTTRLEAFSDGVFAIVITLLVLELHAPEPGERTLGSALGRMWPSYAAFLASFLVVGIIWLNHHAMFALVSRTTHGLQVANLGLLLTVTVLPFPTAVLGNYARDAADADGRTAVLLYGASSTAMSLAFQIIWRYILRHPELQKAGVDRARLRTRDRRYTVGLAAYPLATLIGLISVPVFLVLILALSFMYLLPTPDTAVDPSGSG
jgi:uncharacterized membrane protein